MKRSNAWLTVIAAVAAMVAAPAQAGNFWDNLKKDLDGAADAIQGGIEDITETKKKIDQTVEGAEQPVEAPSGGAATESAPMGVAEDGPRFDPPWVVEIQQRLTAYGLDPGPVDGAFGNRTSQAISAFQQQAGIPQDGLPRPSVMDALRAHTQAAVQTAQPGQPQQPVQSGGTGVATTQVAPPQAMKPGEGPAVPATGALQQSAESKAAAATTAIEPTPVAHSAEALGARAGIPTWNGRLLVKGSGFSRLPSNDAVTRTNRLVLLLALKQFPDIVEDDRLAFAALGLLEVPAQRQIVAAAGIDAEKVFGDAEDGAAATGYWHELDEFQQRALLQKIRSEAVPILMAEAPSLPIPILVLCSVSFSEYDFELERFAIEKGASGSCESVMLNPGGYGAADLGNLGLLTIEAPLATEYLPKSVPVPLAKAEEYKRQNLQPGIGPFGSPEFPVLAVKAQLVALRERESDQKKRRLEFTVDLEGALLFRQDDMTTPFDRLPLVPPASVETVDASPTGPVPLGLDALNLMLLAHGLVEPEDADFAGWAAWRANREEFGGEDPWPRFFPEELVNEVARGGPIKPLLLGNFAEWNRVRARALPESVFLSSRTATLDWIRKDSPPGMAQVFAPPGSGASRYRALAERFGVPEDRVVVPNAPGTVGFLNTTGLVGVGPVKLVLVLPAPRDAFAVPLDPGIGPEGGLLNVGVELRVDDLRIDRAGEPTVLAVDVEPVAARLTTSDGAEIASAAFDSGSAMRAAAAAATVQAEEKAEAEAEAARKEIEAARARFRASADILGIRLGMTLAEAEAIIRKEMEVGWVARLGDEAEDGDEPYRDFRTYISADGTRQIALFLGPDDADRVIAVTRSIPLPEGASVEAVGERLLENYGGDPVVGAAGETSFVWTTTRERYACRTGVRAGVPPRSLDVLEGGSMESDGSRSVVTSYTPVIDVYAGRSQDSFGKTVWEPEKWSGCGPAILAGIAQDSRGTRLNLAILDLGEYGQHYAGSQKPPATAKIKL